MRLVSSLAYETGEALYKDAALCVFRLSRTTLILKEDFMFKVTLCTLCTLMVMLAVSACGRNDIFDEAAYETTNAAETTNERIVFSVLAPNNYETVLRLAGQRMRSQLRQQGIDFYVDITTYCAATEGEEQLFRLQVMLMAGQQVPDMVFMQEHPIRRYAENGFLVDLNALIDQSERFNHADFFENVLEAFEMDGSLYLMPLSFGFDFIGINTRMPSELVSIFSQKTEISVRDIIEIYVHAREEGTGEIWQVLIHSLGLGFLPRLVELYALQFIDFCKGVSRLDSIEFVEFLRILQEVRGYSGTMSGMSNSTLNYDSFARPAAISPFIGLNDNYNPVLAFLENNIPFEGFAPLSDNEGRLILRTNKEHTELGLWGGTSWGSFFVPAGSDNQKFALDFAYYVQYSMIWYASAGLGPSSFSFGLGVFTTPIFRQHAYFHLERVLNEAIRLDRLPQTGSTPVFVNPSSYDVQRTLESISVLHERTMSVKTFGVLPSSFYRVVENFLGGLLMPEQASREMQAIVSLWMLE